MSATVVQAALITDVRARRPGLPDRSGTHAPPSLSARAAWWGRSGADRSHAGWLCGCAASTLTYTNPIQRAARRWRSFFTSGSSALYLFLYSAFYFYTKLDITKARPPPRAAAAAPRPTHSRR